MNYRIEASELDREILAVIERWSREHVDLDDARFDDLALRIFAHQLAYNEPYKRLLREHRRHREHDALVLPRDPARAERGL